MRSWGKGWTIISARIGGCRGSGSFLADHAKRCAGLRRRAGTSAAHRRQARLQRDLGSQQYGELGSSDSRGASDGGAARADPRLAWFWRRRWSRLGSIGWVPGGLGVVEGEEIPYQPWAAARKKENQEHWLDRDPEIKCFQPGVPRAMYMPYPFQIIQSATKIQMVFEFADAQRTIHLNKMEPYPNVLYMGYSVGHWEGDTLVVDVSDFTDATWFDRSGNFHSDALHVVERYTPMGQDAIRYEATIEDPQVFTRPWKISMPLYRRLEPNAQLTDFRCVEMVEETMYGHLRKEQLVKHWEGKTMDVDITRKIPPGEAVYERYISGNPPAAK